LQGSPGSTLPVRRRPVVIALLAVAQLVLATVAGKAEVEGRFLTISYDGVTPIRELSAEYLDDPNLWPDIMKATGIAAVSGLRAGDVLRIPANAISIANFAIKEALDAIQVANKAGAQLFAPRQIGNAVERYSEALRRRTAKDWPATKTVADEAKAHAVEAHDISVDARDVAAEAVLSDRQGDVEGRKPAQYGWDARFLGDLLEEQERVRTLSLSTAQITFRDASRLRLQANSNAVIERMRVDPLTRREESKVSLIEGNFYALLAAEGERRDFEVELPNVETTVESGNFWVANAPEEAKFANYDSGPLSLRAGQEVVTLGRNEGAVVRRDASVGTVDVLAPPRLVAPADGVRLTTSPVEFTWQPLPDAGGYWIEIASDPAFQRMAESHFGLADPLYSADALAPGQYYWRAAALDAFGIPGERSATFRLDLAADTSPPFLRIDAPADGLIVRRDRVEVAGEAEEGARLLVRDDPVETNGGRFSADVALAPGENVIALRAEDAAGNVTERVRIVIYRPDERASVVFSESLPRTADGTFLTRGATLALSGRTVPGALMEIQTPVEAVRAATRAGADGSFTVSVPMERPVEDLVAVVVADSGFETPVAVRAAIDRTAPSIELARPLPTLTARPFIEISGATEAGASLSIGGAAARLDADGRFDEVVNLSPGPNVIEATATDAVGNVEVKTWTIVQDATPPTVLGHSLSVVGEGGGQRLVVSVTAEDESGLASAARARIDLGGESVETFLRYSDGSRAYQGVLGLGGTPPAAAFLVDVKIEDNAGNVTAYAPE